MKYQVFIWLGILLLSITSKVSAQCGNLPQWYECGQLSGQASCDDATAVLISGTQDCSEPPSILVFRDEFDGSELSGFWRKTFGTPRGILRDNNGNIIFSRTKQWYSPSNVNLSGGTLKLKVQKDPLYNREFGFFENGVLTLSNTDFLFQSGEIVSNYQFYNYYGTTVRSKVKTFVEQRTWQAFWLFGKSQVPGINKFFEADIFEFYGHCCEDANEYMKNQKMNVWADNLQCQTSHKLSNTMDQFWIYEFELNRWDQYWRTGTALNSMQERRRDHRYYNSPLQEVYCNNFTSGLNQFFERDRFINTEAGLEAIFSVNVALDDHNQGDNYYLTPKEMEIDFFEVYQKVPCSGNVVYNSINDLDIKSNLYNVKLAQDVQMNNVVIPSNRALKIIFTGTMTINSGTTIDPNSYVVFEKSDQVVCGPSPFYTQKVGRAQMNVSYDTTTHVNLNERPQQEIITSIKFSPNPAQGSLAIEYTNSPFHTIVFTNSLGAEVLTVENCNPDQRTGQCTYHLNLPDGIYVLTFYDQEHRKLQSEKLVILH